LAKTLQEFFYIERDIIKGENICCSRGVKVGFLVSKNILIIRLSSIGDVIHSTPVASSLKAAWPDCKITWLVGQVSAELLQENPDIDEIIIWSREKFEKKLRKLHIKEAFEMWRELEDKLVGKEFYAVLDIHGLFLTGLIASKVKAKQRIGMRYAKELNPLFMSETGVPLGRHITEKYLGVLLPLGVEALRHKMTLVIPQYAKSFVKGFLQEQSILPHEKILVLILATTWSSKNWPLNYFLELIRMLYKDFRIILCGGKSEMELGIEIEKNTGISVLNMVGQTSLLQMAGLIEQAAVLVAGDTGPLHMAAALGVPTVGIFGPTDPEVYAPRGKGNAALWSKLSCTYCHKKQCPKGEAICMKYITPDMVAKKIYDVVR